MTPSYSLIKYCLLLAICVYQNRVDKLLRVLRQVLVHLFSRIFLKYAIFSEIRATHSIGNYSHFFSLKTWSAGLEVSSTGFKLFSSKQISPTICIIMLLIKWNGFVTRVLKVILSMVSFDLFLLFILYKFVKGFFAITFLLQCTCFFELKLS